MQREIGALLKALDSALVGSRAAKTGLILALIARQHAYLEGPPGCGKSLLAETLAVASGARVAAIRFHRDTRSTDLLGDVLLRLQRDGRQERLAREIAPGPLLQAEVALLDDISRAPGEALGPLLRVLSERRGLGRRLPLECAVATALPPQLELYADPLEPTQLDRFAVQVRMRGLLAGRRWDEARELLERGEPVASGPVMDARTRQRLQTSAARLPIGGETRRALLRLLGTLGSLAVGEEPILLTDRAFGVAALAILRAHAFVRGADRVEPEDLHAIRFMLGRRAPESVVEHFAALVQEVIADAKRPQAVSTSTPVGAARGEGGRSAEGLTLASGVEPPGPLEGPTADPPPPADVAKLLRAIRGRLERGSAELADDPAGQPRSYRWLRRLDEVFDADELDAQLWVEGRLPGTPRVFRRERRIAGGTLAVLRDVSASMEGRLSAWAGQVTGGLVRTAARRRMRIGYLEFNHRAEPYRVAGDFFHRRYQRLLGFAARGRAEGRTSYEAPLGSALSEFRGSAGRNRHVVLLSDGVPVLGDPEVRRERALARQLGVKVHTVFLGRGECPRVLDDLSAETGGLCFVGRPEPGGQIAVTLREPAAAGRKPAS
ncbi:MAG: AAA family ATPase [Myxococcota bacterium]